MTGDDKLAAAYLRRLKRATRGLPRARRRELLEQIAEHIDQARSSEAVSRQGSPAALRGALERLGDPQDVAAAVTRRVHRSLFPCRRRSRSPQCRRRAGTGRRPSLDRRLQGRAAGARAELARRYRRRPARRT